MTQKHTPGSWETREIPAMNVIAIAPAGKMMPIASAAHWTNVGEAPTITEEDRANARLIAAAPDLKWLAERAAAIRDSAGWTKAERERSWEAWEVERARIFATLTA